MQLAESTATGEAIFAAIQAVGSFGRALGASAAEPIPAHVVLMSDGGQTVPDGPDAENQPRGGFTAARAAATAAIPVSTISFGTEYGTISWTRATRRLASRSTTTRCARSRDCPVASSTPHTPRTSSARSTRPCATRSATKPAGWTTAQPGSPAAPSWSWSGWAQGCGWAAGCRRRGKLDQRAANRSTRRATDAGLLARQFPLILRAVSTCATSSAPIGTDSRDRHSCGRGMLCPAASRGAARHEALHHPPPWSTFRLRLLRCLLEIRGETIRNTRWRDTHGPRMAAGERLSSRSR